MAQFVKDYTKCVVVFVGKDPGGLMEICLEEHKITYSDYIFMSLIRLLERQSDKYNYFNEKIFLLKPMLAMLENFTCSEFLPQLIPRLCHLLAMPLE